MANFYIDIIDTQNDDYTTVLENASKDAIVLRYNGQDALDNLVIVGSDLVFNIVVPSAQNTDAALIHLFSSDENRWKVELRQEVDNSLVWQGYLLPDSYTEPYKQGILPIGLEATDGLGRLKGKYLEDQYYSEEHSVVDIIASCLALTGLQMSILFAPAIENKVQKEWHSIYLPGTDFVEDNKLKDAYTILFTLIENLVSVVYQHLGYWYVEGLNKRSLVSYTANLYDYQGQFIQNTTVEKIVRDVNGNFLATPTVTIVPPYGLITVNTEQAPLSFPETIAKESNDGWTPAIGVVEEIYASEWFHSENFAAKAKGPEYKVYMQSTEDGSDLADKIIQLQRRVYIKKNTKVKIVFEFSIDYEGTENSDTIDDLISNGHWEDPFRYNIFLGSTLMYTNTEGLGAPIKNIVFNSDREAALTFEFIPAEAGLLNIVFRRPIVDISVTKIAGIFIEDLTLTQVAFVESETYTNALAEDYTVTKELYLTFTDDASAMSKSFRLARLDSSLSVASNVFTMPVLSGFEQNGKFYTVLQLDAVNLIADNITGVFYNGNPIVINDVIYNYNSGEQMVVETTFAITSGVLEVYQYKLKDHDLDRTHWEQWTDAVYEVESKRFGEAVLGVYTRLFDAAYPKVDGTVKGLPVLFADLVTWNYREETLFVPTHLEFNLDNGETTLRIVKSNYLVNIDVVPPFVDCGLDLVLFNDDNTITIDATAYAPSSTIVSYTWTQISGDTVAVLSPGNTEDVSVSNLTGDAYVFQLEVENAFGLTATDTVAVYRSLNYEVELDRISLTNEEVDAPIGQSDYVIRTATYQLVVSQLLANDGITFSFNRRLEANLDYVPTQNQRHYVAAMRIIKNNNVLLDVEEVNDSQSVEDFVLSYINGDDVKVELQITFTGFTFGTGISQISILSASTVNNVNQVIGLPVVKYLS